MGDGVPEDLWVICYIGEINTGVPPGLGGYLRFGGLGIGGCINPWLLKILINPSGVAYIYLLKLAF